MLTKSELNKIKSELDSCENPLFIFHDDGDGICSYLQCYLYKKRGHGELIKKLYTLSKEYEYLARKYNSDKIFALDIPNVTQEFIDEVDVPIVWIDHHPVLERENVLYLNPRKHAPDKNYPVSYLCYKALKESLWIGMLGSISDYHLPLDLLPEFSKKYPDLLSEDIKTPGEAMYESSFGELIKIISLGLKNPKYRIEKLLDLLLTFQDPREVFELEKEIEKNLSRYEKLKKAALKHKPEGLFYIYKYENKVPFSSDLANELIYYFPDKIILLAREKEEEIRGSIRSRKYKILDPLKKSLIGINGTGGGHEYACGIKIKSSNWEKFIDTFKNKFNK